MAKSRFFPSHQLSECEAHVQGLQDAAKPRRKPRKPSVQLPPVSQRKVHLATPDSPTRPRRVRVALPPVVNPYAPHDHDYIVNDNGDFVEIVVDVNGNAVHGRRVRVNDHSKRPMYTVETRMFGVKVVTKRPDPRHEAYPGRTR